MKDTLLVNLGLKVTENDAEEFKDKAKELNTTVSTLGRLVIHNFLHSSGSGLTADEFRAIVREENALECELLIRVNGRAFTSEQATQLVREFILNRPLSSSMAPMTKGAELEVEVNDGEV